MSTPTLILGNNKWAIEEDNILGYAVEDRNGSYLPREIPFTRGSDATFTTSTGVIRQACWNLIGYSEEFDNAYWTKSNSSITTNAATAPNGTLTADTLNINVFTYSGLYRGISGNSSNYTISVYAKKNTKNWLYFVDIQGTAARAWFDLNNGVLGTVSSGYTATITDVGNGWYRCTLYNNSAQTPSYYQLGVSDSNNTTTPSTSGNIFIWGAQLVQGSDALGYLRTTDRLNMPRVDSYTGTKTFLLEPQKTNLALYSDQFNISGTWTNTINGTGVTPTVTTNSTTSPDGTQNAETIVFNRGAGNTISDLTALQQSVTIPTTGAYILSVYAKASTAGDVGKQVFLRLGGAGLLVPITLTGNWVRYSRAETSVASGSQIIQIGNRGTITADNTVSVDLFGAQVEAGAYPTTYIPTQATTVTRIADSAVKTGISGLIGQTEGVLYCDVNLDVRQSYTYFAIAPNITSTATYIGIGFNATTIQYEVVNSGIQSQITFANSSTGRFKIAGAYKENDFVLYVNGTQIGTDTSGTVPTCSEIGLFAYNQNQSIRYNQVALFNTRLTNAELAALTTL